MTCFADQAQVGWASTASQDPGFGGQQDTTSVKARVINLISAVRTVTRSKLAYPKFASAGFYN